MIYFVAFLISCLLFWISSYFEKFKVGYWILNLVALFIPIFLSAVRDKTLGIDLGVYIIPLFEKARSYKSLWKFYIDSDIDIFYASVTYFVSKITKNYMILLGIIQSIIIIPFFFAAYKLRKIIPIWLVMFLYFTILHCFSMNIVRQCMALALCFCSFYLLINYRYRTYCLIVLVAILCHKTAVFALLYPLFFYISNLKNKFLKISIIGCIFLFSTLSLFLFQDIISLVVSSDGGERYAYYQDGTTALGLNKGLFLINVYALIFLVYTYYKNKLSLNLFLFFLLPIGVATILVFFTLISPNAFRLSFYFMVLEFIIIPFLLKVVPFKNLFLIGTLLVFSFCWYANTIKSNNTTVYPYKSRYLKIR